MEKEVFRALNQILNVPSGFYEDVKRNLKVLKRTSKLNCQIPKEFGGNYKKHDLVFKICDLRFLFQINKSCDKLKISTCKRLVF